MATLQIYQLNQKPTPIATTDQFALDDVTNKTYKITGADILTFVGTTFLPLAGGTLTGNLTATKILLNGDVSHIGLFWNGADTQNIQQVQNAQLQAMALTDVAGNMYYHVNSQTNRPKFVLDIETQIATAFINTGVQAGGFMYNSTATLSASCAGTTVTGVGTNFPTNCANGIIYWPSTQQYARIVTRNSTTSLTVDTAVTQSSAPFVIYFQGVTYNTLSNVFAISADTTVVSLGNITNTARYLFEPSTLVTTMSQTGIMATIAGISSNQAGAYVVPASGSPFTILSYQGTTTVPTSVSQTIAGGTACTLYYYPNGTPLDADGGFGQTISLFNNIKYLDMGAIYTSLPNLSTETLTCTLNSLTAPSNSGNQTASQSGTTLTGVGTSWDSSYVGHMIRFCNGSSAFITAVASTTSATATPSQTVSSQDFDIPGKTSGFEATSMDSFGNFGTNNAYINNNLFARGATFHKVSEVVATPYTAAANDYYIGVNVASAATVNIPAATGSGRVLIIKDESLAAATNNITITPASGNIEGVANIKIQTNGGSYSIIDRASANWSIF